MWNPFVASTASTWYEVIMKIKAKVRDGYLGSYALVGDVVGSQEYEIEDNFNEFKSRCYKLVDGVFVFDPIREQELERERLIVSLKIRREEECFKYVDRPFWVESLTPEQVDELRAWRQAWLDVTVTLQVPTPPTWLTGGNL